MRDFLKKRNRRRDIVKSEDVEEARIRFGLKKGEFAELMGISANQYTNCEKKGGFLSFRVYAALDAIENAALTNAIDKITTLHKMKTGLDVKKRESLE